MRRQAKSLTLLAGFLMLASLSSVTAQRANPTPRPRPEQAPRDMAFNIGSQFLYVQAAGGEEVLSFCVEHDGSLTLVGSTGGLPFGAQGIAAK